MPRRRHHPKSWNLHGLMGGILSRTVPQGTPGRRSRCQQLASAWVDPVPRACMWSSFSAQGRSRAARLPTFLNSRRLIFLWGSLLTFKKCLRKAGSCCWMQRLSFSMASSLVRHLLRALSSSAGLVLESQPPADIHNPTCLVPWGFPCNPAPGSLQSPRSEGGMLVWFRLVALPARL